MDKLKKVIIYTLLVLGSAVMLYPLLFGLVAGLMDKYDFLSNTVFFPIPQKITFQNYLVILTDEKMLLLLRNTFMRTTWFLFFHIVSSMLLGYAFSKLKFKGQKVAFAVLMTSMMIPGQATIVPFFLIAKRWPLLGGNNILGLGGSGMLNSWWVLLIPGILQVYYVFLVRQSYLSIPNDFEESARIDGAGTIRIIFQVYMPLLKPIIAVLIVMSFTMIWNDFSTPLYYTSGTDYSNLTISLGLRSILNKFAGDVIMVPNYPAVFAAATIASLPTILIYSIFQKSFVQGIASSGIKG